MADRHLVVADASPLIGLDRAGHLDLLPRLFSQLAAPPAVTAEFGRRPSWLLEVLPGRQAEVDLLHALSFGAGESEAMAVALEHPGSTLLLDEKRARRFATERGIDVVGTVGLVLQAKKRSLVPAVRPVLDDLARSGFRMAEALYRSAVERAGEA